MKFLFTCDFILPRLNPLRGTKLGFFLSPFPIPISWFRILGEAFRNDHVTARSTALRSATEKNEIGCYVTVPCLSKMTQRSSTAEWPNFEWVHQIDYEGTHTEQIFTFKVMLCINSCISYCKLVGIINLDVNYCTSQFKKWIFMGGI